MSPDMKAMMGNSGAAAIGVLASRITGFARMAVAASVLGPTFFGNLFQTVAFLPSSIYLVLMGSLISAVLVPPLVQRRSTGGHAEVARFSGSVLGLILLMLLSIGLLMALTAPILLHVLTVAVADPQIRREQVRAGVPLLLMLIPQIVLYGVAGMGMAVQQAHGRFALAAFAPALENLINIAVLVASAMLFGIDRDLGRISQAQLLLLGFGTTAAVSVHATVQWFGAYRLGVQLMPRIDWHDPLIRTVIRQGGASIGYVACDHTAYLLVLVIAGTVPGGVSAFQITNNFCKLPVALAATPLANAQLPHLSSYHASQNLQSFGSTYETGLRLVIFAAAPAALILAAGSYMFAGAAAFGAMNDPASIALIAACLGGQGVGVIGDAVFMLSTTTSYAQGDALTPLLASAMRLAIVGIGAVAVLIALHDRDAMMFALGASMAVANLVGGAHLCHRVRSSLSAKPRGNTGLISALAVSVVALMPAIWLGQCFDHGVQLMSYERVWFALGISGLTIAIYLVIQQIRGSPELRLLIPAVSGGW